MKAGSVVLLAGCEWFYPSRFGEGRWLVTAAVSLNFPWHLRGEVAVFSQVVIALNSGPQSRGRRNCLLVRDQHFKPDF